MPEITKAVKSWRLSHWLLLFATVIISLFVATVLYVVQNSIKEREQAFETLQIQTRAMIDQRKSQTRRIDLLNQDIKGLSDKVSAQSATIGEQSEQIRILIAQIKALGATPVVATR